MATSISGGQGNSMLFVFGDGRNGHKVAEAICCANDEKRTFQCIGIVVDKKFEKHMEDIKGKGCKIHAIDFEKQKQDPSDMEHIVREHKYDWLVMMPAGDSFQSATVKCVSDIWKKHHGKNVMLLSMAKVEEAEKSPMKELYEAEKYVQECFPKMNVILRKQLPLQVLDFFANELKEKKAWRLPMGEGVFSPVCLRDDVACAICHIAKEKNMEERFQGKVFTLTNTRAMNGNQLAEVTRTALGGEDIKFENISMEEADQILKKFQMESFNRGMIETIKDSVRGKKQDMHRHLMSDVERRAYLAAFEMIAQGKYNFVTDHVKMITGKDPMSVEEYLRKHEENFKPGRN